MIHSELLELLSYDPETGEFIWRVSCGNLRAGAIAGGRDEKGYRRIRIGNKKFRAHRLAWFYVHREWPPQEVDHINGGKDDNRIANLRLATTQQNCFNRPLQRSSLSGFKGVSWSRVAGKWSARITFSGRTIALGCFERIEDAAKAYADAAAKLHGEFARCA